MKQITKEEMAILLDEGILNNSINGLVDKRGNFVSSCKTRNKRYIEDKFADIAKKLCQKRQSRQGAV